MSLLNGIINGIFGPDTSAMSEQDRTQTERARQVDRTKAKSFAVDARNDPGGGFIEGPESSVGTGGDLMETLGKVFKLFAAGGGGG